MDYILHDSFKHSFYMTPKFLYNFDLSPFATHLYSIMYSRTFISQDNGWKDEQGRVYIIMPVDEAASMLRCTERTVHRAFLELEKFDLIERRRIPNNPANRIYVKQPWIAVDTVATKDELEMLLVQSNEGRFEGRIENIIGRIADNKVVM